MKTYIPYSLLAAIASCGLAVGAETAYTTPVGYTTQTLGANKFSFLGLTVHNPKVAAGVLDSANSNSVSDADVDFLTTLGASGSSVYILEINNGAGDGTIQEVSSWNANSLTTTDDISAFVVGGTTTYSIRKASTISDVFGPTNSAGLTPDEDGDYLSGNDIIFVPGAGGAVTQVFYFDDGAGTSGWFDSDFNDASQLPIIYADGFYVQRVGGAPIDLVTSGEVKTAPTSGVLSPNYNFLSSVAPTGLTVGTSGLEDYITPDTTGDYQSVDNIYLPNPDGSFTIVFYFDDGAGTAGWFDSDFNDASSFPLDGGFLLLNRGVTKPYEISIPDFYSSL